MAAAVPANYCSGLSRSQYFCRTKVVVTIRVVTQRDFTVLTLKHYRLAACQLLSIHNAFCILIISYLVNVIVILSFVFLNVK